MPSLYLLPLAQLHGSWTLDTDAVTDDAQLANQNALDYHPRHTFSTVRRLRLPLLIYFESKRLSFAGSITCIVYCCK